MLKSPQVLLVVPDKSACAIVLEHLRNAGCTCDVAASAERARAMLREQARDLILVELGHHALSLDQMRPLVPEASVVALSKPDPEIYFEAARMGVTSVLSLPLDTREFVAKLDAVCAALPGKTAGLAGTSPLVNPQPTRIPHLFATSEEMADVRELIEKVAPTSATVLLKGESGVGKELAARLIHNRSLRSSRPFIKVNCAAIPHDLLESELFGFEAGAFTGAVKAKPGKFELAEGGTIFLDEIGELHPILQAKLLHVVQDGQFTRLGAKRDTAVDVRIICATNRQLDVLVASGQFREDLFYRIHVVTVTLPPLRARTREIPDLVNFFLRHYASTYSKPLVPLDGAAMRALMAYHWPGNIRELENLCKRYVIVGGIDQILRELEQRRDRRHPVLLEKPLPAVEAGAHENAPPSLLEIGRRAAWTAERAAIQRTLDQTRWNRREAARLLGVSYKALLNKIAQMKMEADQKKVVSI